jgi:hypothetical protein
MDTFYGGEGFLGEEVVWVKNTPVYGKIALIYHFRNTLKLTQPSYLAENSRYKRQIHHYP